MSPPWRGEVLGHGLGTLCGCTEAAGWIFPKAGVWSGVMDPVSPYDPSTN